MNEAAFRCEDLRRIICNALPFAASPNDGLRALAAVRLEYDGEALTAVATDRYVLGSDVAKRWQEADAGEPFTFLLSVADAKRLVTMLPKLKTPSASPVLLAVVDSQLRLTTLEAEAKFDAIDAGFPKWRSLVPDTRNAVGRIAWNPQRLARFAKVVAEGDSKASSAMRVSFVGETKLAIIDIGDTFRGLIMPLKNQPWPADESAA